MKRKQDMITSKYFRFFLIISVGLIALSYIYIYIVRGTSGNPIRSDGWGYYSYLPAVFDYHDLTFSFSDDPEKDVTIWVDAYGNYINKYPVGVAILEFPFFIVVDIVCKLLFREFATGYSIPYQIAVLVSTTFYFCMGMICLYRVLRRFFDENVTMWTIISISFATSLFHYLTFDSSFSHIYSFSLIAFFIWHSIKIEDGNDNKRENFILGVCAGLILVTRNPNIIVLLFYVLYGISSKKDIVGRIKKIFNWQRLLWNAGGGVLPIIIQCTYWKIAAGKLVIRSYNESETFSWFLPHLTSVLFSVSKGLVFYSPVIGIAFIGLFVLKKLKLPVLSIFSVMAIHMYVTSAWNCWQYGGSYGQRPFVDVYAIYALMLGGVYQYLNNIKLKIVESDESTSLLKIFSPIIVVFIFLSIKFMLAYWHGVLPIADATMEDILKVWQWNFEEIRYLIENML